MLIVRGINVFPSQIETVILDIPELEPFYQIIVDRVNNLDTLEIQVEVKPEAWKNKNSLLELEKKLDANMLAVLQIKAKVQLVEPGSLPRTEGKAKHVIDKRKL